jgi:hypothetical protein
VPVSAGTGSDGYRYRWPQNTREQPVMFPTCENIVEERMCYLSIRSLGLGNKLDVGDDEDASSEVKGKDVRIKVWRVNRRAGSGYPGTCIGQLRSK